MRSIPHDIWLQIAQYIPVLILRDLLNVNSSLFNIAMDCRYRQMCFAYLDKRMLRSLIRLRDPYVARRVRILHVYPGFLQNTIEKQSSTHLHRRSLRFRLVEVANYMRQLNKSSKRHDFEQIRTIERTDDIVQSMFEVLSGLPNVTDYYVTWCRLPDIRNTAVPFLGAVFHTSLRKLSLDISLENVRSLFTSSYEMRGLEELHLCVHHDEIRCSSENAEIMAEYLAPAINRLCSTLQTLVIQPWEPMDLSPLFSAVGNLPVMSTLSISIPVESPHLGNPKALSDFLSRHSTSLRSLRLRATQYGGFGLTPDFGSFDEWVKRSLCNVKSPKLRSLDISSNLFPVSTALASVGYFAHSITSLLLSGNYLRYEELKDLAGIFSDPTKEEKLEKLRLGPVSLSPQLLDMLASEFPGLSRLELLARDVIPHHLEPADYNSGNLGRLQGTSQIDRFLMKMESRRYYRWNLRHMSILVETLPYRAHYEYLLEQLFLECIPTITNYY